MEVVKNIQYNTFKELWNSIAPLGSSEYDLTGFIYRGETSNKYKLIPSALREDKKSILCTWGKNEKFFSETEYNQVINETMLLGEFYRDANKNGLKLPDVELLKYTSFDSMQLPHQFKWISDDIKEIASLAQHYGVPTRLIDWSRDMFTAFYFASVGVLKKIERKLINNEKIDSNENLVIWALNSSQLITLNSINCRMPIKFVIPQYHNNPNIRAQHGILSYNEILVNRNGYKTESIIKEHQGKISDEELAKKIYQDADNYKKIDRTPLDEILKKTFDNSLDSPVHFEGDITLLYKFELPIFQAFNMFDFISKLNYSAARIFPGYSGVVKTMEERQQFNDLLGKSEIKGNIKL